MSRTGISKKLRFEVFKRDSFTCQYCGKKAPDVILHVDHINPVSKGGDNAIVNLITSCAECNSGKSNVLLDDNSVLSVQRRQLDELNERREQMMLMVKWRELLKKSKDADVDYAANYWAEKACTFKLNKNGIGELNKMIRQYGLKSVLDGIDVAAEKYLKFQDDTPTKESVENCFNKLGGVLFLRSQPEDIRKIYYAKGILSNRGLYINQSVFMEMSREFVARFDAEKLIELAKSAKNWTAFKDAVAEAIYGQG